MDQGQELLPPGFHPANILSYHITETKAGDPAPVIFFNVMHDKKNYRVRYQGNLNHPKSAAITVENLIRCGLKNPEDIERMAEGLDSKALDIRSMVQIHTELQPHFKDPTKMCVNVKGIYDLNSTGEKKSLTRAQAVNKMAAFNLGAVFHKAKQELDKKSESQPKNESVFANKQLSNLDDIPF